MSLLVLFIFTNKLCTMKIILKYLKKHKKKAITIALLLLPVIAKVLGNEQATQLINILLTHLQTLTTSIF